MELRHLRYFVAVAEEGSFGRAAERLHIVQPTLSMQIKALEIEVGGPLFTRTTRRVELTAAGELLLVEARRTLAQAERTKDIVQSSLRGETGTVRVGFAGIAAVIGKVTDDLRAFQLTHPDVRLELTELSPHDQTDAILAGELDIGYSSGSGTDTDPRLVAHLLDTFPMVVAMSTDNPLGKRSVITARDLIDQPIILYSMDDGPGSVLSTLRRTTRSEPRVAHRVSSTLSVLALAAADLGIAPVPAPTAQVVLPNLIFRELNNPDFAANLVLFSRANETAGAALAFLANARTKPST